jgi:protein translocase SecG subunit
VKELEMNLLHPVMIGAHIIFAVAMIAIVLLQKGKGVGLSGVFGAGGAASESFFGGRGPGTFLTKLTAKLSAMPRGGRSIMEDKKTKAAEKARPRPTKPARKAPTTPQ